MNLFDLFAKISLDTSEYDSGIKNVEKSGSGLASKLKSGLASAGKAAAAGLGVITTAAGAVAGGLLALEQSTEEYRIAQGRLNTAFESAGYGAETAKQAYSDLYGILGDTDRATEASQLLAQLSENEEDLSKWTNIAAGVNGTFGDSLPIESLIEAANETAKVGTVTGTLADALNWVGVSEDEFNEKLAKCSDESERNQLIMETLSEQYEDASDAFNKNNKSLIESRKNQVKLNNSLAKLGGAISDVKNRLLSEFVPAISNVVTAFSGMISGAQGAEEQLSAALQSLVDKAVEQIPSFLNVGVQFLSTMTSGIISAIPDLISSAPQIVDNFINALVELFPKVLSAGTDILSQLTSGIESGLPNMVSRIPEIITQFLNYITEQLPAILDKGSEILNSLINGIINSIPKMVAALPQIITAFTKFIADNLPKILSSGISIITKLIGGILSALPSLIASVPQIIDAIVDGIMGAMGSIVDVGKSIVEGIWEGISSLDGWLRDKVGGFFGGILGGIKSFLGIHSPSKVFAGIGENMALGIGQGWDNEYNQIRRNIENGMNFGTANVDFASSGLGISSAGIVNGLFSTMQNGSGGNYTFNLVLPDGSKLASYTFRPFVDYARANGTPILNPT